MSNFKIAFYIRCSTEEQGLHANPEGTIKNQQQRLRFDVESKNKTQNFGEVVGVFIEDGVSAKDTKRPELQRMLKAIEQGEINLVMVTEFSRLSRNMRDFASMWELFKSYKCSVISLRENFDTSTAAGEMMLYNMANLAQYERRMTSERVVLSRLDRAQRGLFNGGMIPLGYKKADRAGYLDIDEEEAFIVRLAFSQFLKIGSLLKTARWLNDHGHIAPRMKGDTGRVKIGQFSVGNLRCILTNKSYIGMVSFKKNGKEFEAKAVWEPLVGIYKFSSVQKILKENYQRKKPHSLRRYPYTLSGLVYCKRCSEVMCGRSAHGRTTKVGYYEHSWSMRKDAALTQKVFNCGMHKRVPAKVLEKFVHEQVEKLILSEEVANQLVIDAQRIHLKVNSKADKEKLLKRVVANYSAQLESLTDRLSRLPSDVPADEIYKALKSLGEKKDSAKKELEGFSKGDNLGLEVPVELRDYQKFLVSMKQLWTHPQINAEVKEKIIKKLVARIELDVNEVFIEFWAGKGYFRRESRELNSLLPEREEENSKKLKNFGSRTCHNGAQ